MTLSQITNRSQENLGQAAISYRAVSVFPFIPVEPFKGLHVAGAGNIVIKGVDGLSATLDLTGGCWPYGGSEITSATATGIVALF